MPQTGQALYKGLLNRICESLGGNYLCDSDKGNRGEKKNKRLVWDKSQWWEKQDLSLDLLDVQWVFFAAFSGIPGLPTQ